MKHLPACGACCEIIGGGRAVAPTHGPVHRCIIDAGHGYPHRCACGAEFRQLDVLLLERHSPISAVMETSRCGECGGQLTNHECVDCGTLHNVGQP